MGSISAFFAGRTRKVKCKGKRLRLIDGASFVIFLYLVREIGREGKKCVVIRTECSVFFPARSARSRTKKDTSRIRLASRIIMLLCAAQEKAAQSACAKENTAVSAKTWSSWLSPFLKMGEVQHILFLIARRNWTNYAGLDGRTKIKTVRFSVLWKCDNDRTARE